MHRDMQMKYYTYHVSALSIEISHECIFKKKEEAFKRKATDYRMEISTLAPSIPHTALSNIFPALNWAN